MQQARRRGARREIRNSAGQIYWRVGSTEMAGLAAVKVELDVEGLRAPPLPDDAPRRAGAGRRPSEMNYFAEVNW